MRTTRIILLFLGIAVTATAQEASGTHRLLRLSTSAIRDQQLTYESQNTATWTIIVRNRSRRPVSCPSSATLYANGIMGDDFAPLAPRAKRQIVIRSRMMNLEGDFDKTGFIKVRGTVQGREVEEWYAVQITGLIASPRIYEKNAGGNRRMRP